MTQSLMPGAGPGASWHNLDYVPQGRASTGAAFREAAEVLASGRLERLAAASIAVPRMSGEGAGGNPLAQTFMQPAPGPGPGPGDGTIL